MTVPTDISGLSRWYKADSLVLSDNSPISTWPDLSGNGADLTASGGDRPTFMTERWNGMPAVVFNGGNSISNGSGTGRPASDVTVFAVVAHNRRGSSPQFVSWGTGASTTGWNLFGSSVADANVMPPSMICLKGSGAWGNNQAIDPTLVGAFGRGDPVILCGFTNGTATGIRVDMSETDDASGDSGSISYGATPVLMLGAKAASGAGAGLMQGMIFEVVIYDHKILDADITAIESYLDSRWKITKSQASYLALFNGEDLGGSDYAIGLGWSPDAKRWKRKTLNPILTRSGGAGSWKQILVKDQWLLNDGSQYRIYYAGFNNASKFQIGYSHTSDPASTILDFGGNPVIALGGAGAIDEGGCSFPVVVHDEIETDPTRAWKMWYAATDASGKQTIAYAYGPDGDTWTKYGRVLDVGSAGAWDAAGVSPGCIWRTRDGTWYLFYQGRKSSSAPSRWQGGVATFTNPESTYTKYASNPTIKALFNTSGTNQALTANLLAGQWTVTVASTAAFEPHMPIFLDCIHDANPQLNRITSIASSTQFSLEYAAESDFRTTDSARVVPAAFNSVVPRGIHQLLDGSYELSVVPFQPVEDVTHTGGQEILREMNMRATLATLTSDAVLDSASGLFGLIEDRGQWDEISCENWGWLLPNGEPPNVLPGGPYINVKFKAVAA